MAAVEENGPGEKKVRSPGFQVQGSVAAAFLTSLNSLPWQLGALPHIQAVRCFCLRREGAWAALRNGRRTPLTGHAPCQAVLPPPLCPLPGSSHLQLIETAHLSLLLRTLEPLSQWPRGGQQSQMGLLAASPLSMLTQLPVILGTPVCPYCSLSSSSWDSM